MINLKELEKLGVKAGVIIQAIKEILDVLVADSLVESDKIGSANFYWSLPSKANEVMIAKNKANHLKIEQNS